MPTLLGARKYTWTKKQLKDQREREREGGREGGREREGGEGGRERERGGGREGGRERGGEGGREREREELVVKKWCCTNVSEQKERSRNRNAWKEQTKTICRNLSVDGIFVWPLCSVNDSKFPCSRQSKIRLRSGQHLQDTHINFHFNIASTRTIDCCRHVHFTTATGRGKLIWAREQTKISGK